MDYTRALAWLYGTQLFGIKLGLDNMRRLADALAIDLARPRFIHVAGTNGKGSTCAVAASVAQAAGHRTGLFTSPHLVNFTERIRVDSRPIPARRAAEILTEIKGVAHGWDPHPTFFEIVTALALRHFQDNTTDVVLLETGMGGRLDATNVVTPAATALTSIALDHRQWLGESLAEIAAEKCGILKPGVPAVSVPQPSGVELPTQVALVDAPLAESTPLGLAGPHQRWNAALALAALRAAGVRLTPEGVATGLATANWPGRFQCIGDGRFVLDGAHNPAAAQCLAATWQEQFPDERATIIFGAVGGKDIAGILSALEPLAARFLFTRPDSPRSADPSGFASRSPSEICGDLAASLDRAGVYADRVLITGSLFLVGEALARLAPTSENQVIEVSAQ